jgi:hypothetical protein
LGGTEDTIAIKVPSEKVWEMLAFDKFPAWTEAYGEKIEYTSKVSIPNDKFRVGATAQGIPTKADDNYCRFEIIESLENSKIKIYAWEKPKYLGILSIFITFSLESAGSYTKFTYEIESDKYGNLGIFGKLLEKLYFRRMVKKQIKEALENLQVILEK